MFGLRKRTIAIILVIIMASAGGLTTWLVLRPSRSEILRIFNWDDFIEPSMVAEFQSYMRARLGTNRFWVRYETYTGNQHLYTTLTTQRSDHDLIVPSAYMLERLHAENRLQRFNLAWLPNLTTGDGAAREIDTTILYETTLNHVQKVTGTTGNIHYGIPYMYGTLGLLVDMHRLAATRHGGDRVAAREWVIDQGWGAMWADGIVPSTKEAGRDNFVVAMFRHYRDELAAYSNNFTNFADPRYQALLADIFSDNVISEKEGGPANARTFNRVAIAEHILMQLHDNTYFETDTGKVAMRDENATHILGMEWSVSAVYAMQDHVSGGFHHHLEFIVPREGTDLWVNSFAIPTTARNPYFAHAFVNWLLNPEPKEEQLVQELPANILNAWWIGGTSPVLAGARWLYEYFLYDEDDLFLDIPAGHRQAWKDQFLDAWFPSQRQQDGESEIISRGEVMRYLGQASETEVNMMMMRVQFGIVQPGPGDGLGAGAIVGIVLGSLAGVGLIVGGVWFFRRRRRQGAAAA